MSRHAFRLRTRMPRVLALAAVALACATGTAHAAAGDPPRPAPPEFACQQGEFCVWPGEFYQGQITRMDLRNTNPDECVPLPAGVQARSFAHRIDRHVTVYQDADCATEGDFSTFPGPGTFVPQTPYVVRAIQIWN